jgi:hypothetical protein
MNNSHSGHQARSTTQADKSPPATKNQTSLRPMHYQSDNQAKYEKILIDENHRLREQHEVRESD